MKNEKYLSCGGAIKSARNLKEMTVNDLAFKMSKTKEQEEVRTYERKIEQWENGREDPSLDDIYLLADILDLNSTELKDLRDSKKKQFTKNYKDETNYKSFTNNLKETLSTVIYTWGKLAVIFVIVLMSIYIIRLFNRSVNDISNGKKDDYSDNVIDEYINETNISEE